MESKAKIYVAGHRGLVGSAIVRRLQHYKYDNIVTRTHHELDLIDSTAVERFFADEKPQYVFLAAAKVGGILANDTFPADFVYDNLMIECNIIKTAHRHGVKKLLFLGSSCIYPKFAQQPIKEEYLLTGPLEPTNEAYATAKIAGLKMCAAFNRQHNANFISVMPTNLYGPGDNYDFQNSHVLPALIRKMHEAKQGGVQLIELWGTGKPLREFLYSDDLADACVFLMREFNAVDIGEHINIGVGKDIRIADLAGIIAAVVGYQGKIEFDHSHPDGTPRKLLDVGKLTALGWQAKTTLPSGIEMAYRDFLKRYSR